MFRFKYLYCKTRMIAYVNGDLSVKSRQRVARYVDECPDCYEEYLHHREMAHGLRDRLPAVGLPTREQLSQIRASVLRDLQTDRRNYGSKTGRGRHSAFTRNYHASYGLAALAIILALILPLMMGNDSVSAAPGTQPPPPTRLVAEATSAPITVNRQAAVLTSTALLTQDSQVSDFSPEAAPLSTPRPNIDAGN